MNIEVQITVHVNANSISDGVLKVQQLIEADLRKVQANVVSVDEAREVKRK